MEEQIIEVLNKHKVDKQTRLVLAMSGGMDSTVLAFILASHKYNVVIAHMNYGLRGEHSTLDEGFVRRFAQHNGLRCRVERITHLKADQPSLQATARDLRYAWLEGLLREENADYILTAHHADDQAETILHQFLRGGRLAALRGMRELRGHVLRPLLHIRRQELLLFARKMNLDWREDLTNHTNNYTRNALRNEVFPLIEQYIPGAKASLALRSSYFTEVEALVQEKMSETWKSISVIDEHKQIILLTHYSALPYKQLFMGYWLRNGGFSAAQMEAAVQLEHSFPGARIEGETHSLHRERESLVLKAHNLHTAIATVVHQLPYELQSPFYLSIEPVSTLPEQWDRSGREIYVDADALRWPLIIRPWREGDRLQPFGMEGHVLVSDLLQQYKVPLHEKKDVYIVEGNEEVLWVIGFRASEKMRATEGKAWVRMTTYPPK